MPLIPRRIDRRPSGQAQRPQDPQERADAAAFPQPGDSGGMSSAAATFPSLNELAQHLRDGLDKKYVLIFAFNGTGKTRLSMRPSRIWASRKMRATPSTSTPSPKTCLPGITTWRATRSACCA
ncbi:MAG: hypothetical protein MZU84_02605 [Sphingobacterium sp.]|nr:hypothetical protein [Sphingobacterium sp.]